MSDPRIKAALNIPFFYKRANTQNPEVAIQNAKPTVVQKATPVTVTTEKAHLDAWQATKKNVQEAFTSFFPISGRNNTLKLNSVEIDDTLDPSQIKSQKEAKDNEKTWGVPVYGNISLVDKEGNELNRSRIKLCTLPKLTNRFSYIVDGGEWQIEKQWRLKSGIYSRIQENGNKQTEFNLLKPFAREPRLYIPFDPETKRYKLKYATANVPLYSILKTLGISDDQMKKVWGEDIYKANVSKDYQKDIMKFYNNQLKARGVVAESNGKPPEFIHVQEAIKKAFDETGLLEDTTKITMGKPYNKVNGDALLHASENILKVERGERPPDNIHSLSFKQLMDVEDYIREKYENKKIIRSLQSKIRNNLDRKTRVTEIIGSDLFNKPMKQVFVSNSLSQRAEQVNPLEMLSNRSITTITGEKGLQNERAIRPEMKIIDPTHFAFLDPVHTPECFDEKTEIFTQSGWKKIKDITCSDQVACNIEGRLEFHKPIQVTSGPYSGLMYGIKNNKIDHFVTPNHRVWCRPYEAPGKSSYRIVEAKDAHNKPRTFMAKHEPYLSVDELARPHKVYELYNYLSSGLIFIPSVREEDWASLLGWFVTEGSLTEHSVRISQSQIANPENCKLIEELLERLPFKWSKYKNEYAIRSKDLSSLLKEECGEFCYNKILPEYIFYWSSTARSHLLDTMLLGDGRINSRRKTGVEYKQQVFTTSSPKLANDFERLAISLGHSTRHSTYPDSREERYLDIHEIRLLTHTERTALPKKGHYYTQEFDGIVYCVTVPGGLVLARRNNSVAIWTGNSEKTGISLHLPLGVKKVGNEAKTYVLDLQDNKKKLINPTELHANYVVLPDQFKWDEKGNPILKDKTHIKMLDPETHEFKELPISKARYVLPSGKGLFDDATNLIPFLQNNQGNRTMTGSRQGTQAVALAHREAPLVQVQSENPSFTWEKWIGNYFSHVYRGPGGKVVEIKKDEHGHPEAVVIQNHEGKKEIVEVYNHFPLNDPKTHLNATLKIKEGDDVKKGQLLADINYTKNGTLALGTNLHVGYFPYKGLTFEDGLVVSETGAKKLSSEHLHKITIELDPKKDIVNKAKFSAYAQTTSKKLTKEQIDKIDSSGIVKPGSKIKPDDLLVTALGKNEATGQLAMVGSRLKGAVAPYKDKSLIWDSNYEGEVIKVIKHPSDRSITVYVKTIEPLQVGDKVVGRHGNKGVVGAIIPDHEMPRAGSPNGKPLDIIMNPSGVASRINIGQLMETAASKIAQKTGKPYVVNNFGGADIDYTEKLKKDMEKHGVSDTEKIWDPIAKRYLTQEVLCGHQYIMKLKHQAEKKLSVRGMDNRSYGTNLEPKGGGEHGAQSLGHLELYALLASGARHTLKETATYKAERPHDQLMNDTDFWDRVMMGHPLPPPKPTFAYRKFEGMLMGLGVNIKKDGHTHTMVPMTDKGVIALSKGEIKDAGMMRGKNEKELSNGLFDPKATGGLPNQAGKGLFWSHFKLAEPIPNPVFVGTSKMPGPAVLLTGLKYEEFEDIARGKTQINGKTGGEAISALLAKVDPKKELEKLKEQLPKLKGAELNQGNRKARYLTALEKTGLKPQEAYIMNYLPIIPPVYRPLVPMDDGRIIFADVNYLYSHAIQVSNTLKEKKNQPEIPEEEKQKYRAGLYDKVKAIAGLGSVPIYEGNRTLKGLIQTIAGDNPKTGFFQSKVMKRRQELSMRGVIIPEPAMHIDQVGLPKNSAMELYKPFVVRELMRMGRDLIDARKEIKESSPFAWKALDRAIQDRPVLLKRDPVLHKYNIQAFRPILMEGNSVKLHPLVCGSFNADFDGDTMAVYLPVTEDAKKEALDKMLPSKNLFSATHYGVMHAPDQEAVLGLHLLTKWGTDTNKTYKNPVDILNDKNLHINDVVTLDGKKTTKGRQLLAEKLPTAFKTQEMLHDPKFTLKKGSIHAMLEDLARHDSKLYPDVVNHLKDLGNKYSYEEGFSFRIKDLNPLKEMRAQILKPYKEQEAKIKASSIPQADKDQKIIDLYSKATEELDKKIMEEYKRLGDNNIVTMVDTKARGSMASLRQMQIGPQLMKDALNRTIPTPILKSYAEGLDIGDYWTTLHGARKGTLQRVEGTSEPGRLTKQIVNLNLSTLITKHDCGTNKHINLGIHRPDGKEEDDVADRVLATELKLKEKTLPAGTIITPEIHNMIKKNNITHVKVRSPLTCEEPEGVCAKCFGLNENGKYHELGTNIGVIASQSMGEPATQLAMDSFHCVHPHSLVFFKWKNDPSVRAGTMEDLFNMITVEPEIINGEEIKKVDELEIYDGFGKWVNMTHVRRHKPDSLMVMISSGGLITICQDNHPLAVYPNKVKCQRCDYPRLKKPSKKSRSLKYYCPKCGLYQVKEDVLGSLCFMPPVELEAKRFFMYKDLLPVTTTTTEKISDLIDPYLCGAYIAEGCVIFDREHPRRISISQNDGAIKDKIVLSASTLKHKLAITKKAITINNSAQATLFHNMFGRYAENKGLPWQFINFNEDWLAKFLCGLIDGDGTKKSVNDGPDQITIDTTSFKLCQQVCFIAAKLNIVASAYLTKNRDLTRNQGFRISLRITPRVKDLLKEAIKIQKIEKLSPEQDVITAGHQLITNIKPVMFNYSGYVYDCTTESGTLMVSGLLHHNTGGVAASRGGASVDKFDRLDQLLSIPKILPGSAKLADVSGKVTAIKKDPSTGGHYIHIKEGLLSPEKVHFAKAGRELMVNIGDHVEKGQTLTKGPINPRELLPRKGIQAVREYLTGALKDEIYKDDTDIRRKNIETVVRNLTNFTKVTDPGDSHHLVGDLVHITAVDDFNKKISPKQKPIKHAPIIEGITQAAVHKDEDYLSRLNFQYIKENILQAAGQGWSTKVKGNNPIPAYAAGTIGHDKLPGY